MRILFATDGSPGADKALQFLLSLPLSTADHVTVLSVPRYTFRSAPDGDAAEALPADAALRHAAGAVAERARARLATRPFRPRRSSPTAPSPKRSSARRSSGSRSSTS